jgi:membrane protein
MKIDLKAFFKKLYVKSFEDDIFNIAAQVAFYFSFAIFPLLLFLVTLAGFVLGTDSHFRADLYYYLARIMPISAFELVKNTIDEVTINSSSGKLTVGFLVALWSASAGVDSLRSALNRVYDLRETRPWWKTKAMSLTFTFLLSTLITGALAIVFYGWKAISFILSLMSIEVTSPFLLVTLQWTITLGMLLIVFEVLYNVLPCRAPFRWFLDSPGAIVGILLWLLLSHGFRTYLSYWNNYNRTYGSIGAGIILMLWLYLTSLVILVGGMVNAILGEMRTDREESEEE